jgi:hypothetical protein
MKSANLRNFQQFVIALSCLFLLSTFCGAQTLMLGGNPEVIEVTWESSKTVALPGFTDVIVLDEDICRAEFSDGNLKVFGLKRGETVALGRINGVRTSIILRVLEKPIVIPPPSLRRETVEFLGQGISHQIFKFQTHKLEAVTRYRMELRGASELETCASACGPMLMNRSQRGLRTSISEQRVCNSQRRARR